MNNWDLFKMAFHNLWRKKTRTFLTVLGVVIGTCSIVIMMSIGIAMEKNNRAMIERMGDLSVIDVNSSAFYREPQNRGQEVKLDDQSVAKIEKIPGVKAVMPIKRMRLKVQVGKMLGTISVIGIKPEIMEDFGFEVEEGRLLLPSDKESLVFGKEVVYNFYDPRSRDRYMGSEEPKIQLVNAKLMVTSNMNYGERRRDTGVDEDYNPPKPHKAKGVGVLAESGGEKDWSTYMNITTLKEYIKEDEDARHVRRRSQNEDEYEQIKVKVKDIQMLQDIQQTIKDMGFQAHSLTDMLESMKEQTKKIQAILGGIGAVSLLVAAIGITNTMVMSIYERTREIGVMKVLGADLIDIKKLFLLEAAMIGLVGGIIGIIISYLVSFGLNQMSTGFIGRGDGEIGISVITLYLSLGGVGFATIVGIISGYLPARRAMNLSALEAIKTE